MANLFHLPQAVRINSTGTPYAGAKANFYLTTTTTKTDTYQDNALGTPHANPVVADAAGQFAPIYLKPSITYRCVITESDDTEISDTDPVSSPLAATAVAVTDTGGYFAGTEVETILADLGANYAKLASTETITADWTFSSADLLMADNLITKPEIKDFGIAHNAVETAAGNVTLDCTTGNSFYHLLTINMTVILSNPPATGTLGQVTLYIKQDGAAGAYTVTWPASVKWPGGTAPVISTANDAIDQITLTTIDAGTTWLGNFSQAYA